MSAEDLNQWDSSVQDVQQKIAELEVEIADLKEQMNAVVTYLRDHESRLSQAEGDIDGVINSRFWKTVISMGGAYRRVFRRDEGHRSV